MAAPAYSWVQPALGGSATTTTTFTITLSTTAANDILVFTYVNRDATAEGSYSGTYSGGTWTTFLSGTSSSPGVFVRWSRATGNHTGETVIVSGLTGSSCGGIMGVTGCITSGSPIDSNTSGPTRDASDPDVNTLTGFNTTVADTLVCLTTGGTDDTPLMSSPLMNAVAMNLRMTRASSGGNDCSVGTAELSQASAGATGSFDFTQNLGIGDAKWVAAFALKPPATTTKGVIWTPGQLTVPDPILAAM